MPHVVIVDARNPVRGPGMMKMSRGARDYVNWFMVFNDIRAEGDISKYEHDGAVAPFIGAKEVVRIRCGEAIDKAVGEAGSNVQDYPLGTGVEGVRDAWRFPYAGSVPRPDGR